MIASDPGDRSEKPRPDIEHYLAGIDSSEMVPAIRSYLEAAHAYVLGMHAEEVPARIVNAANAALIDELIRALFDAAENDLGRRVRRRADRISVLAVGGYARREMAVYSDVDLLFLHARKLTDFVKGMTEKMQYWLWDSGLAVGCATRNVRDTRRMASHDGTVRTALLDARVLAGDNPLGDGLRETVRADTTSQAAKLIQARMDDIRDRHARFEESLYLLQPDLKEGAGGLRDYHAACWATVASYGTEGTLEALSRLHLLTATEEAEYRESLNFLWRTRNELHRVSGRKNDQMSFELQDSIARTFGYAEAEDTGALPVERFMGDYYRHARVVRGLSELVLGQCLSHARGTPRRRSMRRVEDGFHVVAEQLEIPSDEHLHQKPVRLLSAFLVAQKHDVPLSLTAQRLIRQNLDLIDDSYRSNPENVEVFQSILAAEYRVMRTLMTMNEVRILQEFLPEWGHIVCRWQQVLYHTYTVDVHSIFLIEELRRLWKGEYEATVPDLTSLIRNEISDPVVLFLGCMFHDIGKGLGGDHSELGFERTQQCVERLGLAPERAARVCFLVKNHLVLSRVALRRDLSDPKLIVEFARTAGDRENLRNLYLLTFADIRASSPQAWTAWKGSLLRELFERTSEFLESGGYDPRRAFEQVQRRVELRREAAGKELKGIGVADARIAEFFEIMPQRYFIAHTPPQIARHAMVVTGWKPGETLSSAVRSMRGGVSELIICTQDVHGLYSTVAGVLTANGVNILGSHVYTTRSGLALEIYRVTSPPGGEEEQGITWEKFRTMLVSALDGSVDVEAEVRRRAPPVGTQQSPVQSPQSVLVSNAESDFYTIVDVAANDRPGLLFDLTRTFAYLGLEIFISKAATVLDQVTDTFYLKDSKGQKITDPAALEDLRQSIQTVLDRHEAKEA